MARGDVVGCSGTPKADYSSIGLGLAEHYAALPDHTLIMALRNPDSMPDVKCGQGSRVITVKCDAGVSEDALKVRVSRVSSRCWYFIS